MPSVSTRRASSILRLLGGPSRQITAAATVIAAVMLGSFGYDQWQRYDRALADADRDTRNAAILLAESTARTFDGIATAMRAVAALHDGVAAGRYRDKAAIHEMLKAIHGGSPVLLTVGWVDADGNLLASSLYADPPRLNMDQSRNVHIVGLTRFQQAPGRMSQDRKAGMLHCAEYALSLLGPRQVEFAVDRTHDQI